MAALRVLWCGDADPLGLADAVAVPVVVVGWSFQEWAIHKYLLHGLEVKARARRLTLHNPLLLPFCMYLRHPEAHACCTGWVAVSAV